MNVRSTDAQTRPSLPPGRGRIVVIAHRGDHTVVPENTIAAYKQAIAAGADYVEVDLRTTKDGRLVVMHDETVDRMTDGKGKVKDLTYKVIRSLKVTDKSRPGGPVSVVPDFEEVLNACRGKVNIYLDFKDADVRKVYALIERAGMKHHVAVYLNAKAHYTNWKAIAPRMPLISSVPAFNGDTAQMSKFLHEYQVSAIDGSPGDYDEVMISLIHRHHVKIWLDVQDKNEHPEYWMPIIQTGVDGMQSDHPGALIEFLKAKGRR